MGHLNQVYLQLLQFITRVQSSNGAETTYVDTEDDPYNSRKGFRHFHIGWLLVPDPPGFKVKQDTIDLSDLDYDSIVRF